VVVGVVLEVVVVELVGFVLVLDFLLLLELTTLLR
jgi:hypothetical protein